MKKFIKFITIIISSFFLTSCYFTVDEKDETLIVVGCFNTSIREGVTTYKISIYDSDGYRNSTIKYRTKLGTFEIGDTVKFVKK